MASATEVNAMKSKAAHSKGHPDQVERGGYRAPILPRLVKCYVELAASGLCHSDEHLVTGDLVLDPAMAPAFNPRQFPCIGGHEGAGVIVEVRRGSRVSLRATTSC